MVKVPSTMQPLGTAAPDFDLDATNRPGRVTLSDFDGAPALLVMFLCNHCPYVIHIREALAAFGREYQDRGLGIVAISANDAQAYPQDGPEAMAVEAREAGYVFPYLFDEAQSVAKAYGAACTPDFFLFDGDRRLAYRGQFDGSRPGNDVPLTGRDLRAACDAVLEGRPVPQDQLPSAGCNIKWKAGNEPPYFPV
jgi:peroxiredoxin